MGNYRGTTLKKEELLSYIETLKTFTARDVAKQFKMDVANVYARLSNLAKDGEIIRIRVGTYTISPDGRRFLADKAETKHYSDLEATREQHYPAWYQPELEPDEPVTEIQEEDTAQSLPLEGSKSANPIVNDSVIDWQQKYFEQVEFMQELLRNLTNRAE